MFAVIHCDDEEEAVRIANDRRYGLPPVYNQRSVARAPRFQPLESGYDLGQHRRCAQPDDGGFKQ